MKIRHKALRAFHENDDASRLPQSRVERIREILTALDHAVRPGNMDLPATVCIRCAATWAVTGAS